MNARNMSAVLWLLAGALVVGSHASSSLAATSGTPGSIGLECKGVPATSTPTSTAGATETPTATSTPRATVTPRPTECVRQSIELVIIIDQSTSMNRPTSAGRSKHEAAIDAVRNTVGLLDLSQDAMSIVAFNDTAWTSAALGSTSVQLNNALNGLLDMRAEGTRLDLALYEAMKFEDAYRHDPDRLSVVVLLTDGLPNRVPFLPPETQESMVIIAADLLKGKTDQLHTIGLGVDGDFSQSLLKAIATSHANFHHAEDGEELEDIYRAIATGASSCGGALAVAGLTSENILVGPGANPDDYRDLPEGAILLDRPWLERGGFVLIHTPGSTGAIPTSLRGILSDGPPARRDDESEPLEPTHPSVFEMAVGERVTADSYWASDPLFAQQWDLRLDFASDRWNRVWGKLLENSATGNAVIAIMDNGVDCRHLDLNCYVGPHFNAVTGREQEHISHGDTEVIGDDHGTFVAGRCCATTDNGRGIAASDIDALNVTAGVGGRITESAELAGVQWLIEQKRSGRIPNLTALNMSFRFSSSRVCAGLADLRALGVMPFAAVGNDGTSRQYYPAGCASVIGVGSTDRAGSVSDFSQRSNVDIVAPGEGVWSTCKDARGLSYGEGEGTSFSAPVAARDFTFIENIRMDTERSIQILLESARSIGCPDTDPGCRGSRPNSRFDGWGIIQLDEAIITAMDEAIGISFPTSSPPVETPYPPGVIATWTAMAPPPTRTPHPAAATATARVSTATPVETPTQRPAAATATARYTPPAPTADPTEIARLVCSHPDVHCTPIPPTIDPIELEITLIQCAAGENQQCAFLPSVSNRRGVSGRRPFSPTIRSDSK